MGTVSFVVKAGLPRRVQTPNGLERVQFYVREPEPEGPWRYRETPNPDRAARFTLRRYNRVGDSDQIRMRTHDAVGGIHRYMEVQSGIQQLGAVIRTEIEEILWDGVRPRPDDEDEQEALDEAFEAAWEQHDSPSMMALIELQTLLTRAQFRAAWPNLVVEAPAGWAKLDDLEMPDGVLGWLRSAYLDAVDALEGEQGNELASFDD